MYTLHTYLIGHLVQDEHGQTLFTYTEDWLKNTNAIPLSISLPLQEGQFGEKLCRPFFAGVLPDNAKRKLIARNLGISANNDFAMLAEIGGECAGAITFINAGAKLLDHADNYRLLSPSALEKILAELPQTKHFVWSWQLVWASRLPMSQLKKQVILIIY